MSTHETTAERNARHSEIYRVALRITLSRWSRNRSRDEIEEAVSEAYRMELSRQFNKGLDLDESSGHWIMRRAVHLLTGKCAGRSRRVICSASFDMKLESGHDGRERIGPGEWIEQSFHSDLQAGADAIEGGWLEHIDLKVRYQRLTEGSDHANSASDAFRILLDMNFSTAEIAACLVHAGAALTRQATNLWKASGRVPHVYQEQLIALVVDNAPLYEHRDRPACVPAEAVDVPPGRVPAASPETSHHGARVRRAGVIVRGLSPS
jgi:hypothetical protein